jgi:4-amino-4-deoxy-L-arabinose transferase-like glycosyltransferase
MPTQQTFPPARAAAPPPRRLPRRLWPGRPGDPRWARPALLALLAATAVLYLVNLSANGWANAFYSAAVQAGTKSWEAFFYGSSDASNFITVDKPPASLWIMELSARVFGLSSWSVLVPEALMGVASVGVVYAAVRRRFSAAAGLIAGAVLALTPVATLMFRFNNPDAQLALLLALSLYATMRALEDGRTRWLLLAGGLLGFAFLTKTLQAVLVVPAIAVVYLAFGPHGGWRRLRQLLAGLAAMVVAGGWWVAVVELVPAADRPYIGGSTTDDFLQLTFGYNGFGRLTGNETGSVGTNGNWGATGITRLFGSDMASQIAWLLPAALVLLAFGAWATRRARRTDAARSGLLLWGGALLVTFLTFSYMSGIFHPYYNIALAPYIAVVVGMGAELVWRGRHRLPVALLGGALVAGTAVWAYVLLDQAPSFLPWLRPLVLLLGLLAGAAFALGPWLASRAFGRRVALATVAAALVSALAGPAAYAVDTVTTGHTGSLPTAGPGTGFGGGPGGGQGRMGGFGGGQGRTGGFPGAPGGTTGQGGFPGTSTGTAPGGTTTGNGRPGGMAGTAGGGGGGGIGGLLNGATVSSAMKSLLLKNASAYTWVAATVGSQNAASYQLATGEPVMAIGGFNGTDNAPTPAQFEQYVKEGRIHWFIASSTGGGNGGSTYASRITAWVKAHYTATTVGGTTVYDLTASAS